MNEEMSPESFEAFKNSFSYGSRNDLNFKFLKSLPPEEAADFFQELLWEIGAFFDDQDPARLVEHVRRWQEQVYSNSTRWQYETHPFTPLSQPLPETHVALLTSTGHFVAGQDPQPFGEPNMTQAEAAERINEFTGSEAVLSEIPTDTPTENLRVRHGGYDIRGSIADPNTNFPLGRLRELVAANRLILHRMAYSFVGATSQLRLRNKLGPKWAVRLKEAGVQAVLLVPV